MNNLEINSTPGSPREWFELGVSLRKAERFGEAINAFSRAAQCAEDQIAVSDNVAGKIAVSGDVPATDCDSQTARAEAEKIRSESLASIELIQEIRSFANTDLMNP